MVLRITNACIAGRSGMWNILVLVVTSSLLDVSSQEGLLEETLPLMNNCTDCENLYTPFFVSQPYEGDIPITATVGHHVLKVLAFDDDDPFIVRATDDGCRSKDNETLVKVLVWSQPVFNASEQFYSMTTKPVEGEPAQSWCEGIPQAIYNGPGNGSVKYRIIGGDENDHFTINDTGVICNNVKLDREEIAEYHLLVNALFNNHGASGTHMHDGTPMVTMTPDYCQDIRSSELCVFIQVEDINDNKPIFQKDTYAMGIYYDILLGTKIIEVMADDADIGNNSALLYEVEGSQSQLAIEKWSGGIYLAELLDNNKLSTFEFTVKATDDFGNGLSSLRDTNVKIMTTSIQNVIVLTTLLPNAYMKVHSQELVRDLEEQLGLNVAIIDIGPSLSDERQIVVDETDIWYTCTYPQTHAVVAGEDILANPLDDKLKSKWAVLTTSQGNENRWKTTAAATNPYQYGPLFYLRSHLLYI
ncbi:protocadherin-15-like [Ptychodera flava]|uniref:protocadherin-15-like n=1 Tax=Ptychodera flava TaxID=63121 RepID=UPI003969C44A